MKMERLFILVLYSFGTLWRFTECSPIDCLISRLDFFPCQAHENSIAPGSNEYAEYITRISNRNTNPVCTYLNPQIHRNFQKIKRIDNLGNPNIRLLQSPGYALNQKYRPRRLISYNVQCPAGRKPFLIFNDLNLSPKKAECSDYCEDYITITSPDFGSSESCGTHPTDDKFSMESENFIVTFRTSESDGYLGFELGVTCFSPDLIDNGTGGIRKKRTVQFPIRFTPLEEQILKQLTAEFFELIPKCITNDVNATSRLVNTSALHLSIIYEKSSNPVIRTAAESALSIAEHQDSARVKEERQRIAGKCGRNNGDCEQICSETAISVQCSCRTGYTPAPDERSCDDINECLENNGGCQQVCNNIPGSLQCSCKPGYELDTDGINCRDIKECLVNNGGCEQICTNTPGSKQCSCRAGFKMAANGTNCTDINECLVNNGGCRQICNNIPGSRQCRCRPGFILAANGIICTDINECDVNNGGCEQMCTNTLGSRECSCRPGFKLAADGTTCTANLTVSIIVDYVRPADFFPGVNEYRAGSGPVTVTCKVEGPGSGTVSYQWSSTCRNCPFRTATSSVIRRAAVHSGDNGTHTCVVTKGGSTARASIDFLIVDAGIQIFRGSPSGNFPPDNGLVISDNPSGNDFRFRIFCRSDSMSGNVGQFIGLDGNSTLASNSIFAVARRQPGELVIENRVGIQSALTSSQQGVYTCHIPLQSEKIRIFNIGIYPSGFNTSPSIVDLTSAYSASSSNLTCTTTGSPATSVTWTINNQPLIIDGSTYHMVQTVINRPTATYENVLIINRHLSSIVGNTFTCTVANTLGSDDSNILQITVETGLNCGVQLVADSVVSITCDPDFTITAITCTLDGTSLSSCNLPLEIRTTSLSTGTHVVVLSAVGTSVDGRTITRTYTVNITNNVG